ncbi:hypothetical protein [Amycolatopsis sulphurea]|uniref:hypothetical protein n=1 Tax=Amycolatopsis sulphurea TaxID=76022 RepID=UPI001145E65C|nr:hypothetical protein [Amycolatopsis sulphurea]
MTVWALAAVVVAAVLAVLVVRCLAPGRRRQRGVSRHGPDWSVEAIITRVEQERADEAAAWPTADPEATDVLPVISPDGLPTEVLPVLPHRVRPYIKRSPRPWQRSPAPQQPDLELMQRVLDGLKRLE